MNKLLNDALRAKGYAGADIKMVLTDVTDPNGPFYTDTLAKLEDRTKGMVAKEATEDTLASIRNNLNVITGEEGKKLAESIPMDRREYSTTGVSGGVSGSFGGNLTLGAGHYKSIDYEKGIVEEYDTIEGGINFSNPDIGISAGFSYFPFANSSQDIEGRSIVYGGDIDIGLLTGNGYASLSVGFDFIFTENHRFLGIKAYMGKSKLPIGLHGGFVYGTKVINKTVRKLDYQYWKERYPRGWRNSW